MAKSVTAPSGCGLSVACASAAPAAGSFAARIASLKRAGDVLKPSTKTVKTLCKERDLPASPAKATALMG